MRVLLKSVVACIRNSYRGVATSPVSIPQTRRIVEVGLIGIPNAGKSELTNHLIGHKITAVSSKKNTTVCNHLGAYISHGNTQVLLHDLPGVLRPRDPHYKGQLARVEAAWCTAEDCDVVAFIVDAAVIVKNLFQGPNYVIDHVMFKAIPVFDLAEKLQTVRSREAGPKLILALNKIDLVSKENLPLLSRVEQQLRDRCEFDQSFWLSALKGHGLLKLRSYFHSIAKEGEWKLPSGSKTDKSIGDLAVELVRDKLFRRLNQELPYRLEINLLDAYKFDDGRIGIEVVVIAPNDHVRKIIIGHRGSIIQEYVSERSRKELEQILERKVFLQVNVKVKR